MRDNLEMEEWLPLYRDICEEFGFDELDDRTSAMSLSTMIGGRGGEAVEWLLSGIVPPDIALCGGGDSLESDIRALSDEDFVVAADGATTSLLEAGVLPHVIVTDLDGVVEDQVDANLRGAIVFVHAHGDNRGALERWVPEFRGRVVGTCQCPPVEGLVNYGGFTDGDRAACIMQTLGVRRIALLGFDLVRPSQKPGKSVEVKSRKLAWAARILSLLESEGVSFEARKNS